MDVNVHPGSYLLYPQETSDSNKELALLILNQSLPHSETPSFFRHLWDRANYRICVDGGGNQLFAQGKATDTTDQYLPDVIVGDLDSLQKEPRSYYERRGVKVHRYKDQDSTDFMKGLKYLDTVLRDGKSTQDCAVVVLGGLGGRLDHIMHALKVLFNNHKGRQMVVVSGENLAFVVPVGKNRVLVNPKTDGPICGILPLAGETLLTTAGLRWDLDHHPSSFEGLMSTSNIIDHQEYVDIEVTLPVAWTAEFKPSG